MDTKNSNLVNNFFYLKNRYYLNNNFYSKLNQLFCLLLIQIILFGVMLTFLLLGYNNQFNNVPVQLIPENIATYRAISIFLMSWYIVVYIFILKTNISNKILTNIKYISFIPIINLFAIALIIIKNNWLVFIVWFKQNFEPDFELNKFYLRNSWKYKMMVSLLIIMSPIIVLVFYQSTDFLNTYPINGDGEFIVYKNLWFCSIQYFTIQTNLLCYLFVLLFVIKPDFKIFKHHTFLLACIVYIFVVGITYDFALFPMKIVNGELVDWNWYKYLTNIYEHLINPVAFVVCGLILICKDNPKINRINYKKYLFYTMIVPTIYLIYATILPFVTNVSVYGFVTNCNPNVYNDIVEGVSNYLSCGNPLNILFIISYWFIFVGLLTGIYYLDLYKAKLWNKVKIWKKI